MDDYILFVPKRGKAFIGLPRSLDSEGNMREPLHINDEIVFQKAISVAGLRALGGERENVVFEDTGETTFHLKYGVLRVYRESDKNSCPKCGAMGYRYNGSCPNCDDVRSKE